MNFSVDFFVFWVQSSSRTFFFFSRKSTMLVDGYYKSSLSPMLIMQIEGKSARFERLAHIGLGVQASRFFGPCNYGKFGSTAPEVKAKTRKEFYDAEFVFKDGGMKLYSVIGAEGKSFTMIGFYKDCETFIWMSKEELMTYQDTCDPADSPSTFHKIQPVNQGKFLWLTGTGGAGKTTSAFLFGKKHGFVYFEADCFLMHTNPYVPLDVESPAGAFFKQPPLKVRLR